MPRGDWGWSIGAAVLLFGLAVATGTVVRYHDVWRGLIVVLCTVLFLGGWAAIQSRRQKSLAHHVDRVIAGRRWYGILGLSSVVVAWMIVIWGISFPPSTPRGALLSLGASAASCLLGFVCAIVGISDPQSSGKRWCLAAVVACGTLVIFVVARMVFG